MTFNVVLVFFINIVPFYLKTLNRDKKMADFLLSVCDDKIANQKKLFYQSNTVAIDKIISHGPFKAAWSPAYTNMFTNQ